MIKETDIRLLTGDTLNDLQKEVQKRAIKSTVNSTEKHIQAYKKHAQSFDGRYVCADLFKETFPDFNESKEARGYFNSVVHNSAATLSNEMFNRVIEDHSDPEKDQVLFLTGIPGAGKTSSILQDIDGKQQISPNVKAIFEGQVANPATIIEKIQKALDNDCEVTILVVDTPSEIALSNIFKRFEEYGRGASTHIMAHIKANTPSGLEAIYEKFGEKINLQISDRSDFLHPVRKSGWHHLTNLKKEGNYEQIKSRLDAKLEDCYAQEIISENCYRQASSKQLVGGLVRKDESGRGGHGEQRELTEENGQENILEESSILFNQSLEAQRNQKVDIEYSSDDPDHDEVLEQIILAKNLQVTRIEQLLETKLRQEQSKEQVPIRARKGIKGLFSRKNDTALSFISKNRLKQLEGRLVRVTNIKNATKEGVPQIEFLAHKKLEHHYPDLLKEHQISLAKQEQEIKLKKEKEIDKQKEQSQKKSHTLTRKID